MTAWAPGEDFEDGAPGPLDPKARATIHRVMRITGIVIGLLCWVALVVWSAT